MLPLRFAGVLCVLTRRVRVYSIAVPERASVLRFSSTGDPFQSDAVNHSVNHGVLEDVPPGGGAVPEVP